MPDWPTWVWVLIGAIVAAVIVVIILGARPKKPSEPAGNNAHDHQPTGTQPIGEADPGRATSGVVHDSAHGDREDLMADAAAGADAPGEPRRQADALDHPVDTAPPAAPAAPGTPGVHGQPVDSATVDHAVDHGLRPDGAVQAQNGGAQAVRRDLPERDPYEDLRLGDAGQSVHDTRDASFGDGPLTDEQGRRLDPYGNPVDPVDDLPRDEQGRRLDPYGNPVDDRP